MIFFRKGRSLSSQLSSVPDCQKIIKKAVVERLKQKYHVSWFNETDTLYQIQFFNYERPSQHYDRYFRCRAA